MEYPTQTLEVRFRSERHRRMFFVFGLFFGPWIQGRLRWLKPFFTEETYQAIVSASADFVISAGSGLVPLNRCLAKDSLAKSVVVMKPPFPYNFFRYDLALVPAHDRGKMPEEAIRHLITPSSLDEDESEAACRRLASTLRDASKVKISVFLGGATRRYRMGIGEIEKLLSRLQKFSGTRGDFVMTTSRRTPEAVGAFLSRNISRWPACQQLIIAGEDSRTDTVPAMMTMADILIVTEDSVSMISEAVSYGKKVIVLNLGSKSLPEKHRRFHEILEKEEAVMTADLDDLEAKMVLAEKCCRPDILGRETALLRQRLQEIL